jgi:hypothetical protein
MQQNTLKFWTVVCGQALMGISQMIIIVFMMTMLLFLYQTFSATQFLFSIIHFQWCPSPDFGPTIPWFWFRFCYASSMNRSIVILKTIIIICEMPNNAWPQTTVQNFNGHHWKWMIENKNWVAENVWYSRF